MMNDHELERYSRHLLLSELGFEAQTAWSSACVAIIGCGGLGNPLVMYLAAAGVGHIVLLDHDVIELSNLQRQIAFSTADIGQSKVAVLAGRVKALNPHITVTTLEHSFQPQSLDCFSLNALFDCTDNFETRYAINAYCVRQSIALISAAAIELQGLCGVFNQSKHSPCYECLFPQEAEQQARATCSEQGVYSPVLGIMASLQADLGLSVLRGEVSSRLFRWNAKSHEMKSSLILKDAKCKVCSIQP